MTTIPKAVILALLLFSEVSYSEGAHLQLSSVKVDGITVGMSRKACSSRLGAPVFSSYNGDVFKNELRVDYNVSIPSANGYTGGRAVHVYGGKTLTLGDRSLKVGMSRSEVQSLLGTPSRVVEPTFPAEDQTLVNNFYQMSDGGRIEAGFRKDVLVSVGLYNGSRNLK